WLLGRLGAARRSLDDTRSKVCRRDDFQDLEVLRAGDLAVLDARRLQDRVPLADGVAALTLVFEGGPAIHDEHKLESAVMHVPLLDFILHLLAVVADEVCDKIPLFPFLYSHISVFKDLPQPGRPFGITREVLPANT